MKKKNLPIMLLSAPLLLSVLAFAPSNKVEPANAYSKDLIPTTINLNDLSDDTIRNYYSNLNSLNESERRGENLLKNLKGILKDGQKYMSYDTRKTDIWKVYEIVDRDWKLSPASEIEGYNSATKTITGYVYGKSTSSKGSNPYIHALYVDRSVENQMTAWSNHDQTMWGINQEHIWAKSQGFNEAGAGGARGDIMHLWAADGKTNNLHNDHTFGYVDKTKSYSTPNGISYAQNNYLGVSRTFGTGKVFEPQDSDKGDIARALFYMAARYNNFDGDTAIDSDNPNLRLTNITEEKSAYTSSATVVGEYGVIKDLLEWNKLDPVDEFELHRNNLCYNNYTNNRNPFIDFPEWADYIWGENSENKAANPASDDIARPKDFVPPEKTETNEDGLIFGLPKLYVYIGAGVAAVIVLIVIIAVALIGSKKQKKALKKITKKVVKSSSKSKKRK